MDEGKKSSYKTKRVVNFPVVETLRAFRAAVLEALPDLPQSSSEITETRAFSVGYIMERNTKFVITNAQELADAYAAALEGYCFWIDPFDYPRGGSNISRSKYYQKNKALGFITI